MNRAIAVNRHKPRPGPAAQNLRYLLWMSLLCFTAAFAMTRGVLGQRRTDSSMAVASRLHSLRTAIETYWVQHGTAYPGAEGLPQLLEQLMSKTNALGEVGVGPSFAYGPYLRSTVIPDNSLTFLNGIRVVEVMPDAPTGRESWIYSHRTGEIRANSPGSDLGGVRFFDL